MFANTLRIKACILLIGLGQLTPERVRIVRLISYPSSMSGTFAKHLNVTLIFALLQMLLFISLSTGVSVLGRQQRKTDISYVMRITKLQCIDAPYKRTHLNHCQMVQFPNGTVALNTSVTIPMVINYAEIVAKVFYRYTTYRPFIIDWSIDYCQAARKGNLNPTAAIMMRIVENSMPDYYYPCPHGVNDAMLRHLGELTLHPFAPSYIPTTLPSGDYRLDIYFRDSTRITLYALQMFASIRKQGLIG
uniref:Uncharacterized protein n=1 Tax=Anopheles christyi TaxID=43041 RepID=A0A240PP81_9DIPT